LHLHNSSYAAWNNNAALVAAVPLGGAEWLRLSAGWLLDLLAAAPPNLSPRSRKGAAIPHLQAAQPHNKRHYSQAAVIVSCKLRKVSP